MTNVHRLSKLAATPGAKVIAITVLLTLSAFPFVAFFPQPPAFGPAAAAIVAAFAIPAIAATAARAAAAAQATIMRRAFVVAAVTLAAFALMVLSAGHHTDIPTLDVLPKLFGLEGEDIDDAFLYEVWLEIWLACAATVLLATVLGRAFRRATATEAAQPGPWDQPPSLPRPRWNGPTILVFLVGWGALVGAVVDGHGTAAFLSGSVHVVGTIADPRAHPVIQFTAADGTVVQFTQNGFVSRERGAAAPVAYGTENPAGTARADTFWANWSDVLGLVWIGLGFTLAPFFGFRAEFRAGRW